MGAQHPAASTNLSQLQNPAVRNPHAPALSKYGNKAIPTRVAQHQGKKLGSAELAAISDVLQLLGIEDEEDARRVCNRDTRGIEEDKDVDPPQWDLEKMREMPRDKLWSIFHEWAEYSWDNQMGYNIEVLKTKLEA